MIPLQPGDSKPVILRALGLVLKEQEDILITDQDSGAVVCTSDLFNLISSLRSPTDMKFIVQSKFHDL